MSNNKYWLAFSSIEEVGCTFIQKVYEHFGDIERAWLSSKSELEQIEGLKKKSIECFLEKRNSTNPDKVFEYIKNEEINFITFENERYPALLKEIHNPPMTLFVKGDLKSCSLNRTLAVVGSRRASQSAKEVLGNIIKEFSGSDLCIVSGLAEGIDTIAHRAAIESNLKTIGVIASGFNHTYPASNRYLYEQIENGSGCIITEYWPTFEPIAWRFPQRNRIVSGISYGTLVAEAALKSGALITANLTLEQGRELMCMPGALTNPNTAGIYKLLKQGAALTTCADDVLNALGWTLPTITPNQTDDFNFSHDEKKVFDIISIEPQSFDNLLNKTGMELAQLMTTLTTLELKGIIKQIEGETYASRVKI